MECRKIKDLLSEYVDQGLDSETISAIDEHLLTCRSCKEECISLRTLVTELGSFEQIKAPDDFLEKLHERMEPRFTSEKVIRILFFPLRIKIPLELATAAVLVLLVFSFLSIQHPEKMISMVREKSTDVRIAEENIMHTFDAALKEEVYNSKQLIKEKHPQPQAKKREIIELALLIKGDLSGKAYKSDETPIRMKTSAKARGVLRSAKPVPPNIESENRTFEKEDEPMRLETKGTSSGKERFSSSLSPLFHAYLKVKNLIGSMNGTIESVKYKAETGQPDSIYATIPAESYNDFCKNLRGIATLKTSPPPLSEMVSPPVQIHITFISSE